MNVDNKRKDMEGHNTPKRSKMECSYGEACYRRNPAHFREFSHPHLESIIDKSTNGDYPIPAHLELQKHMIREQIDVIVEKQLYEPKTAGGDTSMVKEKKPKIEHNRTPTNNEQKAEQTRPETKQTTVNRPKEEPSSSRTSLKTENERVKKEMENKSETILNQIQPTSRPNNSDYRPIVPPTRRAEDYLKVVLPRGKMAAKFDASAPYHIFYTVISDAKETHSQPYSITFLEILDSSLGELKCSLQINFMVEISWLMAQYYFAGYSEKKLTILYEDDCGMDLANISKKKPQVDAYKVQMASPFGRHHTKMMILCYEDGSLRVVVSTANLYADDWENRTQGLWLSPNCPELPPTAMPHEGESPTNFKRTLLKYLAHYQMAPLSFYAERVERCDFSHINVFLVASVPGSHPGFEWGLAAAGSLLRQHCRADGEPRKWPLVAQASSLGSYGKEARLWLTGDFLNQFTRTAEKAQLLSQPPELKLVYPSFENVQQSHDGLLGGGCLPYSGEVNAKQPWLIDYLHQWRATHTGRNRAMPHIKSYTRINTTGESGPRAAFYLLTSANVSKAAWGQFNKGNGLLRLMSYEAGVLLLPKFVINADAFPLQGNNRLIIPYDLPPVRYEPGMTPWVSDYLCR